MRSNKCQNAFGFFANLFGRHVLLMASLISTLLFVAVGCDRGSSGRACDPGLPGGCSEEIGEGSSPETAPPGADPYDETDEPSPTQHMETPPTATPWTPIPEVSETPVVTLPEPTLTATVPVEPTEEVELTAPEPTPTSAPTMPETTPEPDTGSTPVDEVLAAARSCWASVPFDIQFLNVDRSIARTTPGDWNAGLQWVDYDGVFVLDASDPTSSTLVTVYSPDRCGQASYVEAEIFLPSDFEMRPLNSQYYNNGLVGALQIDGTVAEVNYLEECGNGDYSGWVLPDGAFQYACDAGYSSSKWLGAHGGSHASVTQAIQPGELTSSAPIGRPLPIEVDHTHLKCPAGAASGYDCFIGPIAASGDAYALSEYRGTVEGLTMGGILILAPGYNCNTMLTEPGRRLCEVARDYFFFIVDDSYGEDEVAFPVEDSVPAEVEAVFGINMHNASQEYASDVERLMQAIHVVTNPEEAVRIE